MPSRVIWYLLGSTVVFIALTGPTALLCAWLLQWPSTYTLLPALALAPPVFAVLMHSLTVNNNLRWRWFCMQALGLGAVLMPLVACGLVLNIWVDSRLTGLLILVLWPLLTVLAAHSAYRIREQKLVVPAPQINGDLRIVQISDVHIGSRSAAFLERVVAQANSHKPDVLVITGDLLDASAVEAEDLAALAMIECPAFMCIGNHERYVDLDKALAAIRNTGVVVLRDEVARLDTLQLIGLDDRDKPDGLDELLATLLLDASCFSLLLYHRPDIWDHARKHKIHLSLAGHTHAGQLWPFGHLVKRQYPNMAGLFKQDDSALFVSTGTGTWGPSLRLGTRSEMTVIDLKPAAVAIELG